MRKETKTEKDEKTKIINYTIKTLFEIRELKEESSPKKKKIKKTQQWTLE